MFNGLQIVWEPTRGNIRVISFKLGNKTHKKILLLF